MLYMVELNLTDPAREPAWDEWYLAHLHKLLRVPGFYSAQRFKTVTPAESPLLAIYDVESGDVLTSEAYTSVGGRASADSWKHILNNWHRNLFDYAVRAPDVMPDQFLTVMDRLTVAAAPAPDGFVELKPVGLDRTLLGRAIKVSSAPAATEGRDGGWFTRVLKPMTPRLTA